MEIGYSLPSLMDLAATQIAVSAWSQEKITSKIINFRMRKCHCCRTCIGRVQWNEVRGAVLKEICGLPKSLKHVVADKVTAVGMEIFNYRDFCQWEPNLDLSFWPKILQNLSWTCLGTIDQGETAKLFVQDETCSLKNRSQMACVFCLNKEATNFYEMQELANTDYSCNSFWIELICQNDSSNANICLQCLKVAVECGNMAATKFYFHRLSPVVREEYVVDICQDIADGMSYLKPYHIDAFFYLLSNLSDEQQKKLLHEYPTRLLSCFLKWSYNHLFMPCLESLGKDLTREVYSDLFFKIVCLSSEGLCSPEFFEDYWMIGSLDYKGFVIDELAKGSFSLSRFLKMDDIENIKLFVASLTELQRYRLRTKFFDDVLDDEFNIGVPENFPSLECFAFGCMGTREEMFLFLDELGAILQVCSEEQMVYLRFLESKILDAFSKGLHGNRLPSVDENIV